MSPKKGLPYYIEMRTTLAPVAIYDYVLAHQNTLKRTDYYAGIAKYAVGLHYG